MIEITLRFGLTKSITIDVRDGTTIRELLANPTNKAVLGYPENVAAVIDGVTVSQDDAVNNGDVIVLERQAAAKA